MIIKRCKLYVMTALVCATHANAAGFKVDAINPSNFGLANAGAAADVNDASIVFHNPAGIHALGQHALSASFSTFYPKSELDNIELYTAGLPAGTPPVKVPSDVSDFVLSESLPALFYARPVHDKIAVGFSVTVPFGAGAHYDVKTSLGEWTSSTELKVVDIQPAMSYRFSGHWSVGAGINVMHALEHVDRRSFGTKVSYDASDTAVGFNTGVLYSFNEGRTRIGGTYHSGVAFGFEGDLMMDGVNPNTPRLKLKQALRIPRRTQLAVSHQSKGAWSYHLGVTHTAWSDAADVRAPTAMISALPSSLSGMAPTANGLSNMQKPKWKDTVAVAAGVRYQVSPKWQFRLGYLRDSDMDSGDDGAALASLGAINRQSWATFGLGYDSQNAWSWDLMAGVLRTSKGDIQSAMVNPANPSQKMQLKATSTIQAYTAGVQLRYRYE